MNVRNHHFVYARDRLARIKFLDRLINGRQLITEVSRYPFQFRSFRSFRFNFNSTGTTPRRLRVAIPSRNSSNSVKFYRSTRRASFTGVTRTRLGRRRLNIFQRLRGNRQRASFVVMVTFHLISAGAHKRSNDHRILDNHFPITTNSHSRF